MGHLVMRHAARVAMEKAEKAGVAWVGTRNSNHAGAAACYAMMPLARDMIGLYLAVANNNHMAPWGGIEALLGTNPIAIAVPALTEPPVVLDIATTEISFGRIRNAADAGESLPDGPGDGSCRQPRHRSEAGGRGAAAADRRLQGLWAVAHVQPAGRRAQRRRAPGATR